MGKDKTTHSREQDRLQDGQPKNFHLFIIYHHSAGLLGSVPADSPIPGQPEYMKLNAADHLVQWRLPNIPTISWLLLPCDTSLCPNEDCELKHICSRLNPFIKSFLIFAVQLAFVFFAWVMSYIITVHSASFNLLFFCWFVFFC